MVFELIINNMDSGNVTAERRVPSITSSAGACQWKVCSLWWNQSRVIKGLRGWLDEELPTSPASSCRELSERARFTKRRSQHVAHVVLMRGEHCYSWTWIGEGRWDEMRIGRVRGQLANHATCSTLAERDTRSIIRSSILKQSQSHGNSESASVLMRLRFKIDREPSSIQDAHYYGVSSTAQKLEICTQTDSLSASKLLSHHF